MVLNTKHNNLDVKNIGPKSAYLIATLYDKNKAIFTIEDAAQITGDTSNNLNALIGRLVKKGVVTKLKAGLFNIVPSELGSETIYISHPALIAKKIVYQKNLLDDDYYISHGSAFELHQMVTQPQFKTYCSVTKSLSTENIHGIEIDFTLIKKSQVFGVEKFWINKSDFVYVSDVERTIIDGLKNPKLCGGIIEVAKGLWIKKDIVDLNKIMNYALMLDVGVVYRRLGFLLDLFEIGDGKPQKLLELKLTKTYSPLDPNLSDEGKFISKWKLRLNLNPIEIINAVRN